MSMFYLAMQSEKKAAGKAVINASCSLDLMHVDTHAQPAELACGKSANDQ